MGKNGRVTMLMTIASQSVALLFGEKNDFHSYYCVLLGTLRGLCHQDIWLSPPYIYSNSNLKSQKSYRFYKKLMLDHSWTLC